MWLLCTCNYVRHDKIIKNQINKWCFPLSPDDNLVCWFGYFVKCLILCNITLIVPQLFARKYYCVSGYPFISILCRIDDQTYLSEDSILCFLHISHWTFGATLLMWFLHSLCTSFLPLVTISLTHYHHHYHHHRHFYININKNHVNKNDNNHDGNNWYYQLYNLK